MDFEFVHTGKSDSSEAEEIKRNVRNICSIPAGSIPLARGLGLTWANLSQVPIDLENDYATELIEKVEKYESRERVEEVTFSHDKQGYTTARITLERNEEDG